jgi:hypothetical protein
MYAFIILLTGMLYLVIKYELLAKIIAIIAVLFGGGIIFWGLGEIDND